MAFWSFIEDYQTLIASIVGFGGIILSIWLSGNTSRRQIENQRRSDANGLRGALLAELIVCSEAFLQHSRIGDAAIDEQSGFVLLPILSLQSVFDALSPKLVLLDSNEVQKVVTAYLTVETYYSKLGLLGAPTQDQKYVKIEDKARSLVKTMTTSHMLTLETAIKSLESRLKRA